MLASTLKKYVNELIESVGQTQVDCEYALRLHFVDDYQDTAPVNKEMIKELSTILKEFWIEIFNRLPASTWEADALKWEYDARILPWTAFQHKVAADCGKDQAEYANRQSLGDEPASFNAFFHHEIFYSKIAALYAAAGNSQLELTILIGVIKTMGRRLGYTEKDEAEDHTYPLKRLDEKVVQLKGCSHLLSPVKELIFHFAARFYLFLRECTPRQQALLLP